MVHRNNTGRLGAGFISVCLGTHWLGHFGGFYVPEPPCRRATVRNSLFSPVWLHWVVSTNERNTSTKERKKNEKNILYMHKGLKRMKLWKKKIKQEEEGGGSRRNIRTLLNRDIWIWREHQRWIRLSHVVMLVWRLKKRGPKKWRGGKDTKRRATRRLI